MTINTTVTPISVHHRTCNDRWLDGEEWSCICDQIQEKPMAGSPRYLELLEQAAELHRRKNAGYAGADNPDPWANFRMAEAFGVSTVQGCLVRLSDKYIRIGNLMKSPANDQVGENIKDTLMDLSAYALIAICLIEEEEASS